MAVNAQTTNINGITIFNIIRRLIVIGENTATKHRTLFGSNELIDAKFPVPKNESKTYSICDCFFLN